jgi:hypothetical protein
MTRLADLRAVLTGERPAVTNPELEAAARMRHLAAALDGLEPEQASTMLAVYIVDRWQRNRGGMFCERTQQKVEGRG